ncbi:MAG: HAAS signaling domain-containing protein [Candidatus Promineifilaceae bacterium]
MSEHQFDAYLARVSAELSTLNEKDRNAILDEIRSHIEQATNEETDETPQEQHVRLAAELGDASDLANGFQHAYRPQRFANFLLAAVPTLLLSAGLGWFVQRVFPIEQFVRMHQLWLCLLYLPFIMLSLKRRSPELRLYWLSVGLITAVGAALKNPLTLGAAFGISWVEVVGYVILSVVLGVIFGRNIHQHHNDPLLMTWAWLPIIAALASVLTMLIMPRLIPIDMFGERQLVISILDMSLTPLLLALFFLPMRRAYQWLALGLLALTEIAAVTVLFAPDYWLHPVYWVLIMLLGVTVGFGFWHDYQLHRPWRFA